MRRGRDVVAIKKVQEVRLVQRMAAELAVGKAKAALAAAQTAREDVAAQLAQDQTAWSRSMSTRPFTPEVAAAWSAEVLRSQTRLTEAETHVTTADEEKARRSGEWRDAMAREDTAKAVARPLFARVRRAREETLLAELADRAARKGVAR